MTAVRGETRSLTCPEPLADDIDIAQSGRGVARGAGLCQARAMAEYLMYTGAALDRAAALRRDEAWVAERLDDGATQIVPVWRGRNLIAGGDSPRAVTITGSPARALVRIAESVALLGMDGAVAYFAADVSAHDEEALAPLPDGAEFMDLRQAGALMERRQGMLLAYARGIVYWHHRHRFCGDCGSPTEGRQGGHMRVCTGPACGRQHFPRTDPAVIMLVTRSASGACLLGHQSRWPRGMYSTLAGFVEPGESLEEAVAREVLEEAGITVGGVRYRASQPWPFPSSLMLGFRAEAETTEITCDRQEIEDVRWFTRDEIGRFDDMGLRLPRTDSISRWLIEEWLKEEPA